MRDLTMTIHRAAATSGSWAVVVDPATEEPVGRAPECTPEQLDDAMMAAQAAFPAWAADLDLRRSAMEACAVALELAADELGELTTLEQGMPLGAAVASARGAAASFRRYAALDPPPRPSRTTSARRCRSSDARSGSSPRSNRGTIRWAWRSAPSRRRSERAAPFVVKPSPFTPLASLRMGGLLREHLPAGVLTVVSGGDDLGRAMTTHPVPRAISFTGSVAAGRAVNVAAANDFQRACWSWAATIPRSARRRRSQSGRHHLDADTRGPPGRAATADGVVLPRPTWLIRQET